MQPWPLIRFSHVTTARNPRGSRAQSSPTKRGPFFTGPAQPSDLPLELSSLQGVGAEGGGGGGGEISKRTWAASNSEAFLRTILICLLRHVYINVFAGDYRIYLLHQMYIIIIIIIITVIIIAIIIKNVNRRSSHGHHGSKRRATAFLRTIVSTYFAKCTSTALLETIVSILTLPLYIKGFLCV